MENGIQINIKDAKGLLMRGLRYFIGEEAEWLSEYDNIADWMSDNKGKGLLCVGGCGRGKTVICHKFLPLVFRRMLKLNYNCYNAYEMNEQLADIKESWVACIDDVGVEGKTIVYGEEKHPLWEIIDNAEKDGRMLIVTTNLTTDELECRYGARVIDRLVALTRLVVFEGNSMRR